jgi:site-specific DNA recombinase
MRVACYARYSTEMQRATSIDDQVRVADRYAKEHGWTADEPQVFMDAGISGSSIDGRPGLQALLAAAARRPLPFDVVLVDDSSRIARDIPDAIRVMQTLKFFGVRVIYISQNIDSADEQAETLVAVHGMVDSLYLREMSKKIKRGLEGQQARGFATGGRTFGYRSVKVLDPSGRRESNGDERLAGRRLEQVPAEAETVRHIFQWYVDGLGGDAITARLNRERVPAPRGHRNWKANAVKRVLRNERYLGKMIWGQRTFERRPGTNQKVPRPVRREEWHVQERPDLRIITDEIWERARAREAEVRTSYRLTSGRTLVRGKNAAMYSRHLFSGFTRCGACGGAITVVCGGQGSPRYGCPRSWRDGTAACSNRLTIQAKVADPVLVAGLQAELLRPETLRAVTEQLASALNAFIDQRPRLRVKVDHALTDARARLKNLIDAIEMRGGTPTLLEALAGREQEIARLDAELVALEEPLDNKLAVMPTWVHQQLEDTASLLTETPERTKAVFRQMGVSFTLWPVQEAGQRPFLRAEGVTDFARVLCGQYAGSTTALSDLR